MQAFGLEGWKVWEGITGASPCFTGFPRFRASQGRKLLKIQEARWRAELGCSDKYLHLILILSLDITDRRR